ncbi:MAG: hypothetical protein SWE60_05845 [Thermodesulfobacteriota bacterium]|nr:hypothetical protein [Thermodesulfobacteriota bacterium]
MHWTYKSWKDDSDLQQGDILEPTEKLLSLFTEIHPHFTRGKYRAFLVLTNSCDMVKRKNLGGRCGTRHISLSVVRSLPDIISDSLKKQFGFLAPGIYDHGMKRTVNALAERLVNQNENSLGLFYLHPDIDSGISVHSVAILRVAISVKANEHYDKLADARIGRLSKEFQPKLGWMVGNLYSRVGVTDWKEKSEEEKDSLEEQLITEILSFARDEPIWLEKRIYKRIIKDKPAFPELPPPEQEAIISEYLPPSPKDKIIEIIEKIVKNVAPKINEQHLERIRAHLINSEQFDAQLRKYGKDL